MSTDDLFSDLGSIKDELSDEKIKKADKEISDTVFEEDTVDELFDGMPSIEEDFATDDRILNTTDPAPLIKKVKKQNTRKAENNSDADLFDDLTTIKEDMESEERVVAKKTTLVRKKRQNLDKSIDIALITEDKEEDLFDEMKSLEDDLNTEDRILGRNKEDDELFSDLD